METTVQAAGRRQAVATILGDMVAHVRGRGADPHQFLAAVIREAAQMMAEQDASASGAAREILLDLGEALCDLDQTLRPLFNRYAGDEVTSGILLDARTLTASAAHHLKAAAGRI